MTTSKMSTTSAAAGAEVHARAERHMSEHQGVSYKEALHAAVKADPALAEAYGQPAARVATMATKPAVPVPAPVPMAQGKDAGETVHLRVVALREMDAGLTYQMAVNLVLSADRDLKAAYSRS